MAINKNFVVKNGLEVSTDLIFADANINKVGIGSTIPRTELDVRGGIAATDLYLAGVATIATLRATTGIVTDLLATNITAGVVTSLSIQTTDINVSGFATAQDLQVDGTGIIAVGVVTYLSGTNLNYSGIGTVENLNTTNLNVTGFSTFDSYADFNGGVIVDNLNVTGVSTIATVDINAGDIEVTSVRTSNLNATGVSTIASLSVTGSTFDTLTVNNYSNLSGITTIDNAIVTNLDVVGIATVANLDINGGDIEVSNVDTVDLNVTGVSTLGTVQVSSGIITATSGIVTYYGDGAYLQNISAGIGIGTTGGLVGYAATFINFYGTGVSTAQYDNTTGIATIFFEGGGSGTIGIGTEFPSFNNSNGDLFYNAEYARIFVYYDENVIGVGTDAYWVDAAPFNVGIITSLSNVALAPGSANSPSMYFLGDTQTGFFSPTTGETTFVSAGSSILNINASGIDVTGIVTATTASITDTRTNTLNVTGISTFQSNVHLGDNDYLYIGDSNDLAIFHNGSNSYIQDTGTGDIYLGGDASVYITNQATTEFKASFISNGAVELYYDNSKKFETTNSGVNITGICTATSARIGAATTFTEDLVVQGDARVTGILTIGTASLTIDSIGNINSTGILTTSSANFDSIVVGSAVTINSTGVYTIAGIVTAFDFDTLSDINYKENVETVNNALDIVSDLRGVKFDWKETKQPSYGIIAQELEEVLPELVRGDNPKVVNYNGIIGVLIEAIKELKQELKDLKSSK